VDPGPPFRTTKVNGTFVPAPKPVIVASPFQRCHFGFNFDACDLAGDIHGVHCELATAIPYWHGRDESQTLEVSRHRLPLAFGVKSEGRDDRDKPGCPRPSLDDSLPATASENLGLRGLSGNGGRRNCQGDHGQEQLVIWVIDSHHMFEWC
jgi:hypothetical protein